MSSIVESAMVHPVSLLGGILEVQGDKSISHRVAMLSGIASGESTVKHFLTSEDCLNTLKAMEALGASAFFTDDGLLKIRGTGGKVLEPVSPLDMGNSGTGIRLLTGLLAGFPITAELTGDESLRSRPMARIKEPLENMGARIELLGPNGCAPIRVHGGNLKGIEYRVPVASAQVKSCILLAGLFAEGRTIVIETMETRDHTERLLREAGVPVRVDGLRIELEGYGPSGPPLKGRAWQVPGDFSSAAYALAAVAGRPGQRVAIQNVGLNSRRTALLDVLRRMGATVKVEPNTREEGTEPIGRVIVEGGVLKGTEIAGAEIPLLIDELPLIAALAAVAEGKTVIRDARELRVKESDRISTTVTNLQTLGVNVIELDDGMEISGPAKLDQSATVRSFADHRIAMSMAVLALYAKKPIVISNIACVNTSYPEFWNDLRRLGAHVE